MGVMDEHERLVRRAAGGDREAFSELAAHHWRRLLALVRSVIAGLDAEDVVQEGLVKAWLKLESLRDPAAFRSWLTRIVVTTALHHARRLRVTVPLEESMPLPAGEAYLDSRVDVARLLACLAPRQRAVLHMTEIEGMSDREISAALGIASSSVRAHRLKGRRRLAELVREEEA